MIQLPANVCNIQRYSHVLWISIFVPHQKFFSSRDGSECSVVNFFVVLKSVKILLTPVSRTANKTHPTGIILVTAVNIMQ